MSARQVDAEQQLGEPVPYQSGDGGRVDSGHHSGAAFDPQADREVLMGVRDADVAGTFAYPTTITLPGGSTRSACHRPPVRSTTALTVMSSPPPGRSPVPGRSYGPGSGRPRPGQAIRSWRPAPGVNEPVMQDQQPITIGPRNPASCVPMLMKPSHNPTSCGATTSIGTDQNGPRPE